MYNVYYDSQQLGHSEQKAGMLTILLWLPVCLLIWLYWVTPAQEILIMANTTEKKKKHVTISTYGTYVLL